jgi:hypothetical protein
MDGSEITSLEWKLEPSFSLNQSLQRNAITLQLIFIKHMLPIIIIKALREVDIRRNCKIRISPPLQVENQRQLQLHFSLGRVRCSLNGYGLMIRHEIKNILTSTAN